MAMTTKFKQTKFPAKDLEIRDFRTWCTDNGIDINSKARVQENSSMLCSFIVLICRCTLDMRGLVMVLVS